VLAYVVSPSAADSLKSRSFNSMLLDQLIDRSIFIQEARAAGVAVPDSNVDKIMRQFAGQFEGEMGETFKQVGVGPADFRKSIRRDLTIRAYVQQKIEPAITVNEADARAFYDQNTAMFVSVDSVRARHIIRLVNPDDSEKKKTDERKLMNSLHDRAVKGAVFEHLAQQFSQDGAAARGGDLGYFARGTMVKSFEDVVWGLKVGEISDVFETEFGYHIAKCIDKKKGGPPNFETARPRIEKMLRQRALGSDLENRLKRNRETAIIVRNYDTGA
jgi:parvulin-like peptidyl-prolyl isomerase